jgi:hypothetical protein
MAKKHFRWLALATLFAVKVKIGGIAGIIAPLIGKQPAGAKV